MPKILATVLISTVIGFSGFWTGVVYVLDAINKEDVLFELEPCTCDSATYCMTDGDYIKFVLVQKVYQFQRQKQK